LSAHGFAVSSSLYISSLSTQLYGEGHDSGCIPPTRQALDVDEITPVMRVGVKLPPICDIDVGFAFIPFDQEVCNSVPLLSHLFEEVPRVTNSGCIQPKTDQFLRIDLLWPSHSMTWFSRGWMASPGSSNQL